MQRSTPHKMSFSHELRRHTDWQQCMQCYNSVLPRSIRCILWRTQRGVEDWGQPTSVCHQFDDTEDKVTNDSAFFRCRDIRAFDRKVSMYALINTISNISIGSLSNSYTVQQNSTQLIHYFEFTSHCCCKRVVSHYIFQILWLTSLEYNAHFN